MRLPHYVEEYQGGRQAAKFVSRTFADWGLPVPRTGQYALTNDGGILVLLNPFGCALRVQREDLAAKRPVHDLILKPLGGVSDGKTRIELFPGIHCASSPMLHRHFRINPDDEDVDVPRLIDRHMQNLHNRLARDGFHFWDMEPRNFGFLPAGDGKPDWAKPVVLDMDAVSPQRKNFFSRLLASVGRALALAAQPEQVLSESQISSIRDSLRPPADQGACYGHLRAAFAQAAAQPAMKARKESMQNFWQLCRDEKKRGLLVSGWAQVTARGADRIGGTYEASLSAAPPLRRLLRGPSV